MTTLESVILSYLVNALWQVPVLFAAGWLAARAIRVARSRRGTPRMGECAAAAGDASGGLRDSSGRRCAAFSIS